MAESSKVREVPFAQLAIAQRERKGEIEAVNWLLLHLAESLPAGSATARAIARQATWPEILRLARWEDALEVAILLEEAMQTLGTERSPEAR